MLCHRRNLRTVYETTRIKPNAEMLAKTVYERKLRKIFLARKEILFTKFISQLIESANVEKI
jgi:hypothetical protein